MLFCSQNQKLNVFGIPFTVCLTIQAEAINGKMKRTTDLVYLQINFDEVVSTPIVADKFYSS